MLRAVWEVFWDLLRPLGAPSHVYHQTAPLWSWSSAPLALCSSRSKHTQTKTAHLGCEWHLLETLQTTDWSERSVTTAATVMSSELFKVFPKRLSLFQKTSLLKQHMYLKNKSYIETGRKFLQHSPLFLQFHEQFKAMLRHYDQLKTHYLRWKTNNPLWEQLGW